MRTCLYLSAFIFLTYCILTHSGLSLAFAAAGLKLWFDHMIPALLPFMILSGTLIRLDLTEGFTTLVYPFIKPIFRVSRNVCYVMLLGFLCGFPMGAKCVGDMYQRGKLNFGEASFLLAFCNNIGPVYFISFALPTIGVPISAITLFGMYGLPLLYGLFLRYTKFHFISTLDLKESPGTNNPNSNSTPQPGPYQNDGKTLFTALDESISSALQSILMLGGYMVLFNVLMILPKLYLPAYYPYLAPFLEINGGLFALGKHLPVYSLTMLPFGGLCCIAQTYTCIHGTGLSLKKYVLHKLILTCLTAGFYLCCGR